MFWPRWESPSIGPTAAKILITVGTTTAPTRCAKRLYHLRQTKSLKGFREKVQQLGSYGGGNHFGECEVVELGDDEQAREAGDVFGLRRWLRGVSFPLRFARCRSPPGQRPIQSLGRKIRYLEDPAPGEDKQLVYAPLGTPEADNYLDDMALGANFATVNHMLINTLVLEAFQEVFPGTKGQLVYFISHNIARKEIVNGKPTWVHRKGATRAFPAGHHALKRTPFADTGHPICCPAIRKQARV